MSDDKPPMPKQPTTVALEKPPAWAIAIAEAQAAGFAEIRADISLVSNDLGIVKDRVVILEKWKVEADGRAERFSGGARQLSQTDSKHDAELADEKVAREVLAGRVEAIESKVGDIHSTVVGVVKNPQVRAIARLLFTLAMGYAAAKGIKVLP